jgi:hypothetical protein
MVLTEVLGAVGQVGVVERGLTDDYCGAAGRVSGGEGLGRAGDGRLTLFLMLELLL